MSHLRKELNISDVLTYVEGGLTPLPEMKRLADFVPCGRREVAR